MERKTSEEAVQKAFTFKAFGIGLILVILWAFFLNYVGMRMTDFAALGRLTNALGLSVLTIFLLRLLSSVLKEKGFGEGELILIYVMLMSSIVQMVGEMAVDIDVPLWGISTPLYGMLQSPYKDFILRCTPSFWFPDPSISEPMLLGNAPVPWGAWAIPLLFWLVYQISFIIPYLCLGLILSKHIVETERLPFPLTGAIFEVIKEPKKRLSEVTKARIIGIGLILGFLVQSTYGLLQAIVPAIPKWPEIGYGIHGVDIGPIIGSTYALNQCLVIPLRDILFTVALLFLVPSKILLTALLVCPVAWNILVATETSMGLYTNYPAKYGEYGLVTIWLPLFGDWDTGMGTQIYLLQIGVVFGVTLSFLALSYKALGSSLKAAFSGKRSGYFLDTLLWIGFIGGLLFHFSLQSISGVPLSGIIVIFLMSLAVLYAMMRMRGESILTDATFDQWPRHGLIFEALGGDPTLGTKELYTSVMLAHAESVFVSSAAVSWMMLEGFRLCEMTKPKTSWRGIALAGFISVIIALIISWLLYIWGAYTYGFEVGWPAGGWSALKEDADGYFWLVSEESRGTGWLWGSNTRIWPDFVAGFIVAIVVTALSFRFAWFPLHPIGLILGFGRGGFMWAASLWFQGLLALIIRTLVLRVGGPRFYEEKGLPFVMGIIIGTALANFLYGLTAVAGAL